MPITADARTAPSICPKLADVSFRAIELPTTSERLAWIPENLKEISKLKPDQLHEYLNYCEQIGQTLIPKIANFLLAVQDASLLEKWQIRKSITNLTHQKLTNLPDDLISVVMHFRQQVKPDYWNIEATDPSLPSFKKMAQEFNTLLIKFKTEVIDWQSKQDSLEQERKASNRPVSLGERQQLFSLEQLSTMSLDDYQKLASRLSGNYLSHASRFGFRESRFMSHQSGMNEYHSAFCDILVSGGISARYFPVNPESLTLQLNKLVDSIIPEIQNSPKDSNAYLITSAISRIIKDGIEGNMLADHFTSHFAYNTAEQHNLYGGEEDYPTYFIIPAEIALHHFQYTTNFISNTPGRSPLLDHSDPSNLPYNDVGLWTGNSQYQQIPLGLGIVVIQGDVTVDPLTGSQYQTTVKMVDGEQRHVALQEDGKNLKVTSGISSQDYWENYFRINPEQAPARVVYQTKEKPFNLQGNPSSIPYYEDLFEQKQLQEEPTEYLEFLKYCEKRLRELIESKLAS